MPNQPSVNIIVAMSPNHAIGSNGHLPWHLPEDLARFKQITLGHTIIMGRRTFESLPNGALPGRRNIVLSQKVHTFENCEIFPSLEKALRNCKGESDVFIIGGESIYRQALPLAKRLYITLVDENPKFADTFFPKFEIKDWQETKKEEHPGFSFITLTRK